MTEEAAQDFATLAKALHQRGFEPKRVAHYVNRLLFCMFAEDIRILPPKIFTRMVEAGIGNPQQFQTMAAALFSAMRQGGTFGVEVIDWFNGGLFDDEDVLPLTSAELVLLRKIAQLDWSEVEPSIFGTLFERGLDPAKRSQLGAHYTDRQSIMRIVDPVVLNPLRSEWESVKQKIRLTLSALPEPAKLNSLIPAIQNAARRAASEPRRQAKRLQLAFLDRIRQITILDPACGSGNFLYLSLLGLKDLEHQVNIECEQIGLEPVFPMVGPEIVHGIEINSYAAELARVTIWIGQLQWMSRKNYHGSARPILSKLDQISCRDALLNEDGTEAEWPAAECIVGNPPFLGDKKMISEMGEEYVTTLRNRYDGRVPGGADLVTYWFAKARQAIEGGNAQRAGLVCTNKIRKGANRKVLDGMTETGLVIFNAWDDLEWTLEGAAVRVSIVCFGAPLAVAGYPILLADQPVDEIYTDLRARVGEQGVDVTKARPLLENGECSFNGICLAGPFAIPEDTARSWLLEPTNPNGRSNSDVLKPLFNAREVTQRRPQRWLIDFGTNASEEQASFYQAPFEHVFLTVRPLRLKNREKSRREKWWLAGRPRPAMRARIAGLSRFIVTPESARHRVFLWFCGNVAPEHKLVVIPREDDTAFGILSSRFHEVWSIVKGNRLGVGNDYVYSAKSTFATFPFPEGLTPNIPASDYAYDPRAIAIAEAARNLNLLRECWLNPPELVKREPEVVPGFPDRLIPVGPKAAAQLKKRSLTNLYNEDPTWLQQAHQNLDEAVAAAYGWPADISDDEALKKLFELNLSRAADAAPPPESEEDEEGENTEGDNGGH